MTVNKNIYFVQVFFGILSMQNFVQAKKNNLTTCFIIDRVDFIELFSENVLGLNN